MRTPDLQPTSMLAGAALAAVLLPALQPWSRSPGPGAQKGGQPVEYEYRIVIDVREDVAGDLSGEGWEYVGYLGQSKKGTGSDETLWRRPE